MFDLKDKVAIITGGNGGIGLGMARGLAQAGARIVIAARDKEKSNAAVDELQAQGASAFALAVDVGDEASIETLMADTVKRCGRLDILVNNAGMSIRKPAQDLTLDEWRRVIDINLTSIFLCSRGVYPYMKKSGGGKIINIGSMHSVFGSPYAPAYGASKGGVVQLTKSLAASWAHENIQVNAVLPGWIDSDLSRDARDQVPGLNERVLARTPAGRWGRPDDLAGVAVFLASREADFVTGAAIAVDGGYSTFG
jgi:2-dehydro-3-deoxy-D-gluconate 5-dehydrogenase